jgi:hypothetical protein
MFKTSEYYTVQSGKIKYFAYRVQENNKINLNFEPCEIGKNINIKFKDDLEKAIINISDYDCISSEHGNIPLFYNDNNLDLGDYFLWIIIQSTEEFVLSKTSFVVEIITENDLIDHDNKTNPIIPHINRRLINSDHSYISIDYMFELIKYQTDNGYFLIIMKIL